ncbi:hypothetical protein [Azospirillum sp.]|uniref:hypothetical protein n=1 Tax=Azospirillum sp. TaxID=34012 RepID=UPI0026371A72|nr:hypothetical protein [Azospirillum sp.]
MDEINGVFLKKIMNFLVEVMTFDLLGDNFWIIFRDASLSILKLAFISVAFYAVYSIIIMIVGVFNKEASKTIHEWVVRSSKEAIFDSTLSESIQSFVKSIYDSLSSVIKHLSFIITSTFVTFAKFLTLPFAILSELIERINEFADGISRSSEYDSERKRLVQKAYSEWIKSKKNEIKEMSRRGDDFSLILNKIDEADKQYKNFIDGYLKKNNQDSDGSIIKNVSTAFHSTFLKRKKLDDRENENRDNVNIKN